MAAGRVGVSGAVSGCTGLVSVAQLVASATLGPLRLGPEAWARTTVRCDDGCLPGLLKKPSLQVHSAAYRCPVGTILRAKAAPVRTGRRT